VSPRTGAEPLAELLGVAHRGRQGGDLHVLREVDDHLLPDGAALAVGQVVHLVHHDVRQPAQPVAARAASTVASHRPVGVQHVAQHLGGHHDHVGVAVDDVVTGEQADPVGAVALDQVVELLVRQRLDRRRVEALVTGRRARCTANSPTTVLPAPVGAATSTLRPPRARARGALEGVQPERVAGLEVRQRPDRPATAEGRVALRGRKPPRWHRSRLRARSQKEPGRDEALT
jgi:hypothetical protein